MKYVFSMTGDDNVILRGTEEQLNNYFEQNDIEYYSDESDDLEPLTVGAFKKEGSEESGIYHLSNQDDAQEFLLAPESNVIDL